MRISDWSSDVCSSDLFPLSLAACGAGVALDEMAKETPRSACEEFTRSLLDSPSAYRLVEVSQWEEPLTGDGMAAVRDRQPLIGDGVPGLLYVGVEFDAMNEMGDAEGVERLQFLDEGRQGDRER